MKVLKQFFVMMFMVAGLTLAVAAQKDDNKQDKPKPKPPVIKPGDKPPRDTKPPKDDKPQKPEMSFLVFVRSEESTAAA